MSTCALRRIGSTLCKATQATTAPLKLINTITGANLTLTQGLIWIEDVHYNAEKAHEQNPAVPDQRIHTYAWDNVAFDGHATYRDLSYDVLDATEVVGTTLGNRIIRTGWFTQTANPVTLQTLPVLRAPV